MKNRLKYIFGGLLIIFLSSSCEKWLDVTSDTEIRAEDQFKTEAGFKDALMGVYINMTDPSLYAKDLSFNMIELLAQQYATLPSLAVYDYVQRYEYESSYASPRIDAVWNKTYNTIANINSALSYIDKNSSVLHPINYSIIKGELLGLRAFLHFDLLRIYGVSNLGRRDDLAGKVTIPYVKEYSKDLTQQKSYAQTIGLMLDDIDEALLLLEDDPVYPDPTRPEGYYNDVLVDDFLYSRQNRFNYYAAMALKARVLLWEGTPESIAEAGVAAETVIDNTSGWADLIIADDYNITTDPVLYQEHIFNLNVTAFEDIVDVYLDASDPVNYNALYILPANAESLFEVSNPDIGGVDIRYQILLESQSLGKVCVKLRQHQGAVYNAESYNIVPLMKISEMYYIAAESALRKSSPELNKTIDYLNTVRLSRGILEEIPSDADEATLTDEIYKEYRKEFISEGQLFFYYKRLGMIDFPGLSSSITADDNIYMLPYPDSELSFGRIQ